MANPKTLNRGATWERGCWMAKLRRMERSTNFDPDTIWFLSEWGAGRTERDNAKPGGLGRKWQPKPKGKPKHVPQGQGRG